MIRIIELSENDYMALKKDGVQNHLALADTIIAHSIPYEEKPQGEWGKWVITEIQCPNCFEYFETYCYSMGELDECPNCGAKMKMVKKNETHI